MKRILHAGLVAGVLIVAPGAQASEENLKGTWSGVGPAGETVELEFDGWDMLTVRYGGDESVIADYALEGTSLFITDIEGPFVCDAEVATATYQVRLAEDHLELTASGDECAARADRLDGRIFTRLD